ncbi:DUF222 domain-containing protein [Pseudonocardiaceae bacterium YIM PH 21723]|nr:DUF222 domain-containing protein [Pseudonocardiaceae bacterium YIM PH 21723]
MTAQTTPANVAGKYRLIATVTADFLSELHLLLSTTDDYERDREETRVLMKAGAARMRAFAEQARSLAAKLPRTQESLAQGAIDVPKAKMLINLTKPLLPDLARQVEDRVIPIARELSIWRMRSLGERIVREIDPVGAETRHQRRKRDRSLTIAAKPDGMGELRLYSTLDEVQAAYQRVDRLARDTRPNDDQRTQEQARVDLAVAALTTAGNEINEPIPEPVSTIPGPRRPGSNASTSHDSAGSSAPELESAADGRTPVSSARR